MGIYIYQKPGWPKFHWDKEAIAPQLASIRLGQGKLMGRMEAMGFTISDEALLETLTINVQKTSEIEGELLNEDQVRSSVARKLGMDIGGLIPSNRNIDGIVEMMLDATQNYNQPLTKKRLLGWHTVLFPAGNKKPFQIKVGKWRTNSKGPMQVVSGSIGREKVHFEAPPAEDIEAEMKKFLEWFNSDVKMDSILKASVAHLWFVTIHPFEDGNGRIARAIADLQLARADNSSQRFYSMSAQIQKERNQYYTILEQTQKGSLNISKWQEWFLDCLNRSLDATGTTLSKILYKAKFWNTFKSPDINERQTSIINKMLDDFEGKLTSSKWAKMCKCSHDTALRDIHHLIEKGILQKEPGGGRSTAYELSKVE